MLTEQTIRGLVKEPVCDNHIKFLQHYLNNKSESTFLNGAKSYHEATKHKGTKFGNAKTAYGCLLVRKYKNLIHEYLRLLKIPDNV